MISHAGNLAFQNSDPVTKSVVHLREGKGFEGLKVVGSSQSEVRGQPHVVALPHVAT